MKKALSILFAVFLLASGMQVSLDRHYCSGNLAGTRLSLTGKLASCGMPESGPVWAGRQTFNRHCCEDQVSIFSFNCNYFPEYFKINYPATEKSIFQISILNPVPVNSYSTETVNWVLPPGALPVSGPTQSKICLFRI